MPCSAIRGGIAVGPLGRTQAEEDPNVLLRERVDLTVPLSLEVYEISIALP